MDLNNINVTLLSPLPPPSGGIATWTKNFVEKSASLPLNVKVIDTALSGLRKNNPLGKRNIVSEILRYFSISKQVKRDLYCNNSSIYHLNTSCSFFGLIKDYLISKKISRSKKDIVLHFHCNIADQIKTKLHKKILSNILALSSCNIVLNKQSYCYLKEKMGKESFIVANFVGDLFLKSNSSIPIGDNIKKVLYVGNIQESKGSLEIFKAAQILKDIDFIMVGHSSKKMDKIKKSTNVYLIGEVLSNDLLSYYMKSDVFVFPSYTEGFSLSILEAMSFGLPIICTQVGGNEDSLDKKGAIYIKRGDYLDIVKAISLLQDKDKRTKMSFFNFERVRKLFAHSVIMHKYYEIYHSLLRKD